MENAKRSIYKILFLSICTYVFACEPGKTLYIPEVTEGAVLLDLSITIPPGGNSWVINSTGQDASVIYDSGIHNWTSLDDVIRTYFQTTSIGELHVGLNIKSEEGPSTIKVTAGDTTKEIIVKICGFYFHLSILMTQYLNRAIRLMALLRRLHATF